jgi:hypothetical protein
MGDAVFLIMELELRIAKLEDELAKQRIKQIAVNEALSAWFYGDDRNPTKSMKIVDAISAALK